MDQNIIRQIQKIRSNNEQLLQKIRSVLSSVDSFVLAGRWNSVDVAKFLRSAAVFQKKSLDSSISLNVIYKNLVYDNYDISEKNFFKNAIYISDTIPEEAPKYTPISFDISYRNKGLFNSWTDAKGIKLRVRVYKTSGTPQLYDPVIIHLDTTENVPGDLVGETNADYNRAKIFHVITDNDYPAGDYTFTATVIDNTMSESDYDDYYINSPYAKQITITE